jgi:hypothetical protein
MTDSLFISFICAVIIIQVWRVIGRPSKPLTDKQLGKMGLTRLPSNADQLARIMTPEQFDAHMREGLMKD